MNKVYIEPMDNDAADEKRFSLPEDEFSDDVPTVKIKTTYFRRALTHEIPELEEQGWRFVNVDDTNPSGCIQAMGYTAVLMERDG